MKYICYQLSVNIPEGIKVKTKSRVIVVEGKRGKLVKDFRHLAIDLAVIKNKVQVTKYFSVKKEIAAVRTVCSHIKNMFKGVTYGFLYKMKSAYAHFPINMVVQDGKKSMEIRNYLGQKDDRLIKMAPGVMVDQTGQKDEIIVFGNDVENVSKSAALIHQCCMISNKDIRKFLDGIYVTEKTTIDPME